MHRLSRSRVVVQYQADGAARNRLTSSAAPRPQLHLGKEVITSLLMPIWNGWNGIRRRMLSRSCLAACWKRNSSTPSLLEATKDGSTCGEFHSSAELIKWG